MDSGSGIPVEAEPRTIKGGITELVNEALTGISARSKNTILSEIRKLAKDIKN